MDRLILRYLLVILIGVLDGAVLHTRGAARTFALQDIPGLLDQGYLEVACFPFHTVNFSIGQDLYVRMPADLDQLG
jgi:hypothetical protein